VHAFVVNFYYFLVRKFLIIERRLDMAFSAAVYFFSNRVVGEFGDICMAVPARDIFMSGVCINVFVDMVSPFSSKFIDPTDLRVFMSHKTIFFVCCALCRTIKKNQEEQ